MALSNSSDLRVPTDGFRSVTTDPLPVVLGKTVSPVLEGVGVRRKETGGVVGEVPGQVRISKVSWKTIHCDAVAGVGEGTD